ncbi:MAG: NAD(P)-dependent oxidoreductase [Methylotenera sp.]|nr:MAG: NAD(P)-dependent oxidoreductase [Methylotenera sp.]
MQDSDFTSGKDSHSYKDHRDMDQPPQHQNQQPGVEAEMEPRPQYIDPAYKAAGKLEGKVAIITGGDSGIGRAIAVHFAAEGADVVINYYGDQEEQDAEKTIALIEEYGGRGLAVKGDIGEEDFCVFLLKKTLETFGQVDIIINNAAQQYPQDSIEDITQFQLEKIFRINIFSMFYLVKAALPLLKEGSRIINTASVTAYKGNANLLDYSTTKGAIISFTRSLAEQLVDRTITVNAVAPGPIWTPLIPASFPADKVAEFGKNVLMKRPGQPSEVAPAYVFLASNDASYITGQVIHPNGGVAVNG